MSAAINQQSGKAATKPRIYKGKVCKPKWIYQQESDYYLTSFRGGVGSGFLYSHDVQSKYRRKSAPGNERTDAEKIEFLKRLFARGGTRHIPMSPQTDDTAFIVQNGKTISGGTVLAWNPTDGWHQPRSKSATRTAAIWKLWMPPGPSVKAHTAECSYNNAEFRAFADTFPALKPQICERYTDPATGEIDPHFLMCAFLGKAAHSRRELHSKAYLFHQPTNQRLRVDLGTGTVCGAGEGSAWVTPHFFQNLQRD